MEHSHLTGTLQTLVVFLLSMIHHFPIVLPNCCDDRPTNLILFESIHGCSYIRVKRRDKTYCLLCEQADTIGSVKEKLAEIIQQFQPPTDKEQAPILRLLEEKSQAVLEDSETLESSKIADNGVLHLVYCIDEDDEVFEPVEVVAQRELGESN